MDDDEFKRAVWANFDNMWASLTKLEIVVTQLAAQAPAETQEAIKLRFQERLESSERIGMAVEQVRLLEVRFKNFAAVMEMVSSAKKSSE